MHKKTLLLDKSTDIKDLSHSVRDFYLDRGYSVEIYTEKGRKTVLDAAKKKKRLNSVMLSRVDEGIKLERRNNYFLNNVLIFGSLLVIQASVGRLVGGIFGQDSVGYVIGIAAGLLESLFCFIPESRENRNLEKVISERSVILRR